MRQRFHVLMNRASSQKKTAGRVQEIIVPFSNAKNTSTPWEVACAGSGVLGQLHQYDHLPDSLLLRCCDRNLKVINSIYRPKRGTNLAARCQRHEHLHSLRLSGFVLEEAGLGNRDTKCDPARTNCQRMDIQYLNNRAGNSGSTYRILREHVMH